MKELVIISGKGGTGKTSVTASFAALAGKSVLADCDVDAADLHLLLKPEIRVKHEFVSGWEAVIDPEKCRGCGTCRAVCRFGAVAIRNGKAVIDPFSCEGCGVCVELCPEKAIRFPERHCGEWYESETRCGTMIHARLAPAAENSGKLVTQVRKAARDAAEKEKCDLLLVDGPPGIGCPVIASLTGADAVFIVAEPTVSGEHDMERVIRLAGHFGVPVLFCVNKWDLNPGKTEAMEARARSFGASVMGRIPYDMIFNQAMVRGELVVQFPENRAAKSIFKIWENVCRTIGKDAKRISGMTKDADKGKRMN